jgi:ketosteroid isomerase-like protein
VAIHGDLLKVKRLKGAATLRARRQAVKTVRPHGVARATRRKSPHLDCNGTDAMRPALIACTLSLFALDVFAATLPSEADLAAAAADVRAAETAFARTMADRRFDRFGDFVAEDAVFNGRTMQIGHAAVLQAWKMFFDSPKAPFSWSPDATAPTADGRYAISTGLVRDKDGKLTGRFTSIWRKDADGHWRVVADQGVGIDCPIQ